MPFLAFKDEPDSTWMGFIPRYVLQSFEVLLLDPGTLDEFDAGIDDNSSTGQ